MFGNLNVATNPVGGIEGAYNYHHPFKRSEAEYFGKHHQSYYRNTDGIPMEKERMFVQHHRSIENDFNNLINFNPTNKGLTYYHEHETNKLIHYPLSRPRFLATAYKDTEIIDKIEKWRKDGRHYHNPPEHSQTLNVRNNV
jgi:hypothetical protein